VYDGSKFQLARGMEANPETKHRGGVLRYASPRRPTHFDVHQSGENDQTGLGRAGALHVVDNLIRADRRDQRPKRSSRFLRISLGGGFAKDGKTYHLPSGRERACQVPRTGAGSSRRGTGGDPYDRIPPQAARRGGQQFRRSPTLFTTVRPSITAGRTRKDRACFKALRGLGGQQAAS